MHFIKRIPRRRLLQGLGASVAAIPFLRSIPSAEAADDCPRRIVFFASGNSSGQPDLWTPSGNGNEFALPASLPAMLQPLQPHRDRLLMIGRLKMHSYDDDNGIGGHKGFGHMLTGRVNVLLPGAATNQNKWWGGGISLDQHMGNELGVQPLTLASVPGNRIGPRRMSYSAASQPVDPIEDPVQAFNQTFGDIDLSESEQVAVAQRQVLAMDNVALDLERLKPRLPQTDREKLDVHLDHLMGLQADLQGFAPAQCSPTPPEGDFDYRSQRDFPITARRHMDIIADALACGVTTVASIQNGFTGGVEGLNDALNWPSEGISSNNSQHFIEHLYFQNRPDLRPMRIEIEKFYVRQFVYLIDRLNSYPEGNGTVLDNTLVVWVKGLGPTHRPINLLNMVVAGSGFPELNLGRYIDRKDQRYNNFMVSLLNLMGIQTDTFGAPQYCTGALAL